MFGLSRVGRGRKIWVTADLHFGHELMVNDVGRPWKNTGRHDNGLIRNACELVGPDDIYIINGDLTMFGADRMNYIEKIVAKLPGKKVLVFGNHDRLKPLKYNDLGFLMATTSLVLDGGVLVAHDPAWATVWPKDQPMLCGHIHDLFKVRRNVVNVGVDVWDYKPVLLEEAVALADLSDPDGEEDWRKLSKERHRQ